MQEPTRNKRGLFSRVKRFFGRVFGRQKNKGHGLLVKGQPSQTKTHTDTEDQKNGILKKISNTLKRKKKEEYALDEFTFGRPGKNSRAPSEAPPSMRPETMNAGHMYHPESSKWPNPSFVDSMRNTAASGSISVMPSERSISPLLKSSNKDSVKGTPFSEVNSSNFQSQKVENADSMSPSLDVVPIPPPKQLSRDLSNPQGNNDAWSPDVPPKIKSQEIKPPVVAPKQELNQRTSIPISLKKQNTGTQKFRDSHSSQETEMPPPPPPESVLDDSVSQISRTPYATKKRKFKRANNSSSALTMPKVSSEKPDDDSFVGLAETPLLPAPNAKFFGRGSTGSSMIQLEMDGEPKPIKPSLENMNSGSTKRRTKHKQKSGKNKNFVPFKSNADNVSKRTLSVLTSPRYQETLTRKNSAESKQTVVSQAEMDVLFSPSHARTLARTKKHRQKKTEGDL